jgi:hypothetical protein
VQSLGDVLRRFLWRLPSRLDVFPDELAFDPLER